MERTTLRQAVTLALADGPRSVAELQSDLSKSHPNTSYNTLYTCLDRMKAAGLVAMRIRAQANGGNLWRLR